VSFSLYALTANRGAQWQDSGHISLRLYLGELSNPLGLALVHPLHYWLGRLALAVGGLEPVHAITLVSALAGAVAVANVYGCVLAAVGCVPAAVFAAASLAVANTFWHLATITEVYTLTAALLSAECWCLLAFASGGRRWAFWLMLLFNGLGLANHLQAGLTSPVLAIVAIWAWRGKRVGAADVLVGAGLWVVGSLPYAALVVAEWASSGDLGGTLRSALVGKLYAGQVLNTRLSMRLLGVSVAFVLFNFPNLLLPAAVYGITRARQVGAPAMARRALLAGLVVHVAFVFRYSVVDQHTFFLPVYVVLCIFGGIGAAAVLGRASVARVVTTKGGQDGYPPARRAAIAAGVAMLVATPLVYWGTAAALRYSGLFREALYGTRHKPYRDDYEYLLIPWSVADTSADQMSREAIELAGDDGLVITEDEMARFAIEYRALRSHRRNLAVDTWPDRPEAKERRAAVLERARFKAASGGTVVLVPLNRDSPDMPPPKERWARKGDLYVLDPGGIPASMGSVRE